MSKKIFNVIAGTPDRPLVIGKIQIPCYVLEDETRVLRERSVATTLGIKGAGAYWLRKKKQGKGAMLPEYLAVKNLEDFINDELREKLLNPITYTTKEGSKAQGLPAELLPEICNIWLEARVKGALSKTQKKVAKNAEILIRGLAHVGIIALVDETTGYQEIRVKNALAKILEQFIAKELQPWTKTFPIEFYQEIFRLREWSFPELANGKKPPTPSIIGKYTLDIVYKRLGPGIFEELQKVNPFISGRGRKNRLFRWFTPDIGHPKVKEHLAAVMALMRMSSTWHEFNKNLKKAFPISGDQGDLELKYNISVAKSDKVSVRVYKRSKPASIKGKKSLSIVDQRPPNPRPKPDKGKGKYNK